MKQHLDEQLCANYPEIFRDRHKPMTETAMCWGFACGDGWYPLINTLCRLIMSEVKGLRRDIAETRKNLARQDTINPWAREYYSAERLADLEQKLATAEAELPIAAQVKEKFGGLRFYVDRGNDIHHAYIRFAETMSYTICEECGATRDVYQTTGWVHTVCVPCATSRGYADDLDRPDADEKEEA